MQVFSLFLKIVKKNIVLLCVYVGVFLMIVIMNQTAGKKDSSSISKCDIAFYNNDNDTSSINKGITKYLDKYTNKIDIDADDLDLALYYGEIEAAIIIPKGFSEAFNNKVTSNLEIMVSSSSQTGYSLRSALNDFMAMSNLYYKDGLCDENNVDTVVLAAFEKSESSYQITAKEPDVMAGSYYNYLGYILAGSLIAIIGAIMFALKPLDIRRRMNVCAVSNSKISGILILCNLLLGLFVYGLLVAISFILVDMNKYSATIFILNGLLFTMIVVVVGYLFSVIFKSKMVIFGLGTVISLGLAFITGMFIPQAYLSSWVLNMGKVLPSYWFVRLNDKAVFINSFNSDIIKEFLLCGGIQVIFIAIFVAITIFVTKKNQTNEN